MCMKVRRDFENDSIYRRRKTIELEMRVWNGFDYDPAFEDEFFDVGGLEYDANEDAYIVEDVEYLIDSPWTGRTAARSGEEYPEDLCRPALEDRLRVLS